MTGQQDVVAIILAAGLGTRMRSGRAKVLHPLAGLPLVTWSVRAARPLVDRVVVVVGHDRAAVIEVLADEGVAIAVQEEQRGTGHALLCALPALGEARRLVVMVGDMPGLRTQTLSDAIAHHEARHVAATVLTFRAADPAGYGRIVRSGEDFQAIVEHAQASPEILRIDEVNSGTYVFEAADLLPLLPHLPLHGAEIYLTDALEILRGRGRTVAAFMTSEEECAGINTQAQLGHAEARWRERRVAELREGGVTIVDGATVALHADVQVGPGSVLAPFVALEGRTIVGSRCDIGSLVRLRDVRVGDGAIVRGPFGMEGGEIAAGARIGG